MSLYARFNIKCQWAFECKLSFVYSTMLSFLIANYKTYNRYCKQKITTLVNIFHRW